MKIRKLLFPPLLVCTMLALIHWLFARALAKPAPGKPATRSTSYDAIDAYIEGQMRRLNIPGISLAIREATGSCTSAVLAVLAQAEKRPLPQTPFFIGSLTKSITALAVMQLVEAGKVELDAPVQCYLPWFRVADPRRPPR